MQNEYLMHFNPFHDPKNGQFTSGGSGTTRSEAKKYQKRLTGLTVLDVKNKGDRNVAQYRYNELQNKINKAKNSQKAEKLQQKYGQKMQDYKKQIELSESLIRKGHALTNAVLKEASEKGYTINSKQVHRDAAAGEKIFANILVGYPGVVAISLSKGGTKNTTVETTKYKVKK